MILVSLESAVQEKLPTCQNQETGERVTLIGGTWHYWKWVKGEMAIVVEGNYDNAFKELIARKMDYKWVFGL